MLAVGNFSVYTGCAFVFKISANNIYNTYIQQVFLHLRVVNIKGKFFKIIRVYNQFKSLFIYLLLHYCNINKQRHFESYG